MSLRQEMGKHRSATRRRKMRSGQGCKRRRGVNLETSEKVGLENIDDEEGVFIFGLDAAGEETKKPRGGEA